MDNLPRDRGQGRKDYGVGGAEGRDYHCFHRGEGAMKLLHCVACNDVLALRPEARICACGESSGRYMDEVQAEYHGPSRILGLLNNEITQSLREPSPRYNWFVIAEDSESIHRTDGKAGIAALDAAIQKRGAQMGPSRAFAEWVMAEAAKRRGGEAQ